MVKTTNDQHLYKVFAEAFYEIVEPHLADIKNNLVGVDGRLDSIDSKLDKLESDTYFIKQNIKEIKLEFTDVPTRQEFNKLQLKVDVVSP